MATSKLALFNETLGHLKEGKLASLAEATERRYVLDDYYDGAQLYCLEAGFWNFAMRVVEVDKSVSLIPSFGFTNAFEKPTDWVRTYKLSASEQFVPPLVGDQITEEAGVWYADVDPLYVQYVSSSASYGLDLSLWPPSFQLFFTLYLAHRVAPRIATSDTLTKDLEKACDRAKRRSQAIDAMNQPIGFPPRGSWVSSRTSTSSRARDADG